MPYIDEQSKKRLAGDNPRTNQAMNAGQLTYQLQQVLEAYLTANGLQYQRLAECLGALDGAKIDLTDRVIKPYEMRKARENGDVWPAELTNAGYKTPAAVSDNDKPKSDAVLVRQAAPPPSRPITHLATHPIERSASGMSARCLKPGCDWAYEYD